MLLLTLRDLQHRKSRVVVVVALVALVLTLLYLMSGLVNQLKTEPAQAIGNLDVEEWIIAEGVASPFTAVSVLPLALESSLDGATPVVVSRTSLTWGAQKSDAIVFGHRRGALGSPTIIDGEAATTADQVVVDDSLDLGVGDSVSIGGELLTVVGLTEDSSVLAGVPFIFTDLTFAQQAAFNSTDVVSAYVGAGGLGATDGADLLTTEEVATNTLEPIDDAIASIDLVRALLWIVAAIVVGAVIYLSALERTRDFAILKAVGAGGSLLGGGLALQAVIIALTAAIIGGILATFIQPFFPLPVKVPTSAYWQVPIVAMVIGLLAAVVGVRRVNQTDPAEAFGGAGG